jgi:hypothetical protein
MLTKYDIIIKLARRFEMRRYLEICTPTTGLTFAKVDSAWLRTRHRLVYFCPDNFDDGEPVTYRTTLPSSHEVVRNIEAATDYQLAYDIVFVDPRHTLDASRTDLEGAWRLLAPGGYIVVHDCNPETLQLASATERKGAWCGETYRAYLDFVWSRSDASFFTVDTDFGCGVVHKTEADQSTSTPADRDAWLAKYWQDISADDERCYAYFDSDRRRLLRLIQAEEFEAFVSIGEEQPYRKAMSSMR